MPGHRSAETLAAGPSAHSFSAHGAGVGEVEVFHGNGRDVVPIWVVEEPGDCMPDLSASTVSAARKIHVEALWTAEWVAMLVRAIAMRNGYPFSTREESPITNKDGSA